MTPLSMAAKRAEDAAYVARRDAHRAAWNGKAGCWRDNPALAREIEAEWLQWVGDAA